MLNDNDSSWAAQRMQEAINIIEAEWTRPCVLFKPKLYFDGNRWCAILGDNIQVGVVTFGQSPAETLLKFDSAFYEKRFSH